MCKLKGAAGDLEQELDEEQGEVAPHDENSPASRPSEPATAPLPATKLTEKR
jgi:hypothetical protein